MHRQAFRDSYKTYDRLKSMPIVIVLTPVIGKPNLIDFHIAFENRSFKDCTTLQKLWDCIADQCEDEFQTLGPGYMVKYQTREHLPENLLDTYRKGKCVIVELGIRSPSDRNNIDWNIKCCDGMLTGCTPLHNVWSTLHHQRVLQKGIALMNQLVLDELVLEYQLVLDKLRMQSLSRVGQHPNKSPRLTGNSFLVSLS